MKHLVFGGEQVPLSDDHQRRLTRLRLLETFPGWTIEYAEMVMEERPTFVNDVFALERARDKYREREASKARSSGRRR